MIGGVDDGKQWPERRRRGTQVATGAGLMSNLACGSAAHSAMAGAGSAGLGTRWACADGNRGPRLAQSSSLRLDVLCSWPGTGPDKSPTQPSASAPASGGNEGAALTFAPHVNALAAQGGGCGEVTSRSGLGARGWFNRRVASLSRGRGPGRLQGGGERGSGPCQWLATTPAVGAKPPALMGPIGSVRVLTRSDATTRRAARRTRPPRVQTAEDEEQRTALHTWRFACLLLMIRRKPPPIVSAGRDDLRSCASLSITPRTATTSTARLHRASSAINCRRTHG